ncbi:MAG: LysR family transcriptional regulator [Lysobacter sp.]|nr:LysR family transcriptional regulator [Lysobacter sp.]
MNSHDSGEKNSRSIRAALPPLGGLRCFEAAARLGSFTRAAEELHLTHGAISRAVLRDAAASAFDGLAAAVQELRSTPRSPVLVLSCEPTLLMRWLIPRLPSFHARHPQIALQLVAGGGPVGFGEVDLAIRRDDFERDARVHAALLFEERIGPVCSPRARAQAVSGAGSRLRLRARATRLHSATRPSAWSDWARASGRGLPEAPSQRFEHFYFSLQAASAGVGVAIGPWQLVRDEIDAGLLDAPFGFVADGSAYHLLSPAPIAPESDAAQLLDWLRSQA